MTPEEIARLLEEFSFEELLEAARHIREKKAAMRDFLEDEDVSSVFRGADTIQRRTVR
jgi:hypothetical protein